MAAIAVSSDYVKSQTMIQSDASAALAASSRRQALGDIVSPLASYLFVFFDVLRWRRNKPLRPQSRNHIGSEDGLTSFQGGCATRLLTLELSVSLLLAQVSHISGFWEGCGLLIHLLETMLAGKFPERAHLVDQPKPCIATSAHLCVYQ